MNLSSILAGALALAATSAMPAPEECPAAADQQLEPPAEEYLNPATPIRIRAGRRFSIRLASNPTTGYSWKLAAPPNPAIVRCLTNTFLPPATTLCGAGGHEAWTFQAAAPGNAAIHLEYRRPWETNQPPARDQVFHVIVQ